LVQSDTSALRDTLEQGAWGEKNDQNIALEQAQAQQQMCLCQGAKV
jgi:hypothetical protein